MTDKPTPGSVFIPISALKHMIAWSLLCLHIIETKGEEFEITLRADGVVVQTLRGK